MRTIITYIAVTIIFLLGGDSLNAQELQRDTLPITEEAIEREVDAFIRALNAKKKGESYFFVGSGLGNRQFSLQNAALNVQQVSSQLFISPTAGYMHRGGFGITYLNYIGTSANAKGLLQHAISASYSLLQHDQVDAGIFYTAYFGKKAFVKEASPYDHDIFAFISTKKGFLQPGLAIGWAQGRFRDIARIDTFLRIGMPPIRQPVTIIDTATFRVSDFSIIGTLRHEFSLKGFKDDHALIFTPQLMLVGATNRTETSTQTTIVNRRTQLIGTRFTGRRFQNTMSTSAGFQLQSLGLSLDLGYNFTNLYINPQLYVDCYLGATDVRRFSGLFSINVGIIF